ncbi:hypothetical protein V9T40_011115 [Parthenolecanium corni]|uniref:Uncharacterized protein n=1 Tax=Parthenolecanium corni TaxID=536013 RepID=A0AAN9T8C4_9HEMI
MSHPQNCRHFRRALKNETRKGWLRGGAPPSPLPPPPPHSTYDLMAQKTISPSAVVAKDTTTETTRRHTSQGKSISGIR